MSGAKGSRKPRLKYTNEQVEQLIDHNVFLQAELKKIRLPKQMTPQEYNDVVNYLKTIKEGFDGVEQLPELVDADIINLKPVGNA